MFVGNVFCICLRTVFCICLRTVFCICLCTVIWICVCTVICICLCTVFCICLCIVFCIWLQKTQHSAHIQYSTYVFSSLHGFNSLHWIRCATAWWFWSTLGLDLGHIWAISGPHRGQVRLLWDWHSPSHSESGEGSLIAELPLSVSRLL